MYWICRSTFIFTVVELLLLSLPSHGYSLCPVDSLLRTVRRLQNRSCGAGKGRGGVSKPGDVKQTHDCRDGRFQMFSIQQCSMRGGYNFQFGYFPKVPLVRARPNSPRGSSDGRFIDARYCAAAEPSLIQPQEGVRVQK
jgi:hypothetical protein